jgi:hypothetical protein
MIYKSAAWCLVSWLLSGYPVFSWNTDDTDGTDLSSIFLWSAIDEETSFIRVIRVLFLKAE